MSAYNHAVLWIDHRDAHVAFFSSDHVEEHVIHAPKTAEHIHSKAGSASGTHQHGNKEFFGKVAETLAPARSILVLGPSDTKTEFVSYLDQRKSPVRNAVVGIVAAERMTDKQLIAKARHYFKAVDRLNPVVDLTAGKGVGTH